MSTPCASRGMKILGLYRYALRTYRARSKTNFSVEETRKQFDNLLKETDEARLQAGLKDVWSELSFARMSLTITDRPKLPTSLEHFLHENGVISMGTTQGSGYMVVSKDTQSMVASDVMDPEEKAKKYNMALSDADIRRHRALNERFHFNGPQRFKG